MPVAAAAGVLAAVRAAAPGRPSALLACLQVLGTFGLVAAAGTLSIPAWQVIDAGTSVSGAGRMAPMFVAVLALEWIAQGAEEARAITHRFLERGIIPPITVLLFFWGLLLLLGKRWNSWLLRRALKRWRSGEPSGAAAPIVSSLEELAAGTARVEESLALLWRRYEESYLLPRYISWAMPILGFIGTVLGISFAADGIRRIIGSDAGLSGLSSDLSGAIAPLGIAFDTTLIALSLSVVLTLFLSLVQRDEERILAAVEWEVRGSRSD